VFVADVFCFLSRVTVVEHFYLNALNYVDSQHGEWKIAIKPRQAKFRHRTPRTLGLRSRRRREVNTYLWRSTTSSTTATSLPLLCHVRYRGVADVYAFILVTRWRRIVTTAQWVPSLFGWVRGWAFWLSLKTG